MLQALLWLVPLASMITLRQTMQAGHLNFLNRYLRQMWMAVAIGYTIIGLYTRAVSGLAASLHAAFGGYPVRGYFIVGALGAVLFCGYWALITKAIPQSNSNPPESKPSLAPPKSPPSEPPNVAPKKTPHKSKPEIQHEDTPSRILTVAQEQELIETLKATSGANVRIICDRERSRSGSICCSDTTGI